MKLKTVKLKHIATTNLCAVYLM